MIHEGRMIPEELLASLKKMLKQGKLTDDEYDELIRCIKECALDDDEEDRSKGDEEGSSMIDKALSMFKSKYKGK